MGEPRDANRRWAEMLAAWAIPVVTLDGTSGQGSLGLLALTHHKSPSKKKQASGQARDCRATFF